MQPVAKREGPAIWCAARYAEDKHKPDRMVQRPQLQERSRRGHAQLKKCKKHKKCKKQNTSPLNSMAHHSTHGAAGRGWLELKVRTTPTHASSAATREVFSAGIMIQCPVRLVFRLELAGAGFRWLDRVAERVGRAAL